LTTQRIIRYSISQKKHMPKQPKKVEQALHSGRTLLLAIAVGCFVAGGSLVYADQYDTQIQSLKNQNAASQSTLSQLQLNAGSYQGAISQLQAQIASMQQLIVSNQAKQADLQQQITTDQAQITSEKQSLGDDIKTMYIDGQTTTIEELATSKNLSDYVDKEEYRTVVQNKINDTINQITTLEGQLQTQKSQVDQLLQTQQTQQTQLDAARAQQSQLLSLNVSQQTQFGQQIASNNSQIKQLQAAQAAAIRKLQGSTVTPGGTGGYPWWNASCPFSGGGASCGNYDWAYDGNSYDQWGYEYRNCTSYVAWKIVNTSSSPIITQLISQLGNASSWPSGASRRGVPVSYGDSPQVGDAAVDPGGGGFQGHVMYVERVNGDGSIFVSQYNAQENGTYSTATISASQAATLDFIHFPGM
jgi:surface antigen/peptidoglycan hydrolase CwlO-like protein